MHQLLPEKTQIQKERVVKFTKESAFLTVWVCQLIKKREDIFEAITDIQIHRKLCSVPLEESTKFCHLPYLKVVRVSAILAATAPCNLQDSIIRSFACQLGDISESDFYCIVRHLQGSGLFSKYAGKLLKTSPYLGV